MESCISHFVYALAFGSFLHLVIQVQFTREAKTDENLGVLVLFLPRIIRKRSRRSRWVHGDFSANWSYANDGRLPLLLFQKVRITHCRVY